MTDKILRFAILLLTLPITIPVLGQDDSIAIVQLLKKDYATMSNWDIQSHLRNITSDYLLIENGEIWDIKIETDSLYKKNAHRILTRTDYFTFKTVKVFNDIAYAVYGLKSEFRENNSVRVKVWNESTIFRKEQGQWKIALIHSTPVKQD